MTQSILRPIFLAACLALFAGASCQRATDPAPDDGDEPAADTPAEDGAHTLPPAQVDEEGVETATDPASVGDRIVVNPEQPLEGVRFDVRAGPLTFRNGCEGIERSFAEGPDAEGRIELRWEPRVVPPGSMCTMALHSQWIEVSLEGLEAGEYLLVAEGVGEKRLTIAPLPE